MVSIQRKRLSNKDKLSAPVLCECSQKERVLKQLCFSTILPGRRGWSPTRAPHIPAYSIFYSPRHNAHPGLSRFPCMELLRVQRVSDSVGRYAHIATHRVALPMKVQGRHTIGVISELKTSPAYSPANASPPPYGKPTHDSGP